MNLVQDWEYPRGRVGRSGHGGYDPMVGRVEEVLEQALQLSTEDRARIAAALLASVDGPPDPGADAAWAKEIERRAARALAGQSTAIDSEVVKKRVEDSLRGR